MWLYFVLVLVGCAASQSKDPPSPVVTWKDFMKRAGPSFHKYMEPFWLRWDLSDRNLSSECKRSLKRFVTDFDKWESWAVEMADSNAKFPSGVLNANQIDLGTFDECLEVRVPSKSNQKTDQFKAQYCLVGNTVDLVRKTFKYMPDGRSYRDIYGTPPEWTDVLMNAIGNYTSEMSYWFGVCLPSTCTEVDIYRIFEPVYKPLGANTVVKGCQTKGSTKWPLSAKIALSVLGTLTVICTLSTLLDIKDDSKVDKPKGQQDSLTMQLVKSFSVRRNAARLLVSDPPGSITCFHGLRVLSSIWVIVVHMQIYDTAFKTATMSNLAQTVKGIRYLYNLVESGMLAISNFLFISGFLLVYLTWNKLEKSNGKLDIITFFVHKYFRLIPGFIFTVCVLFAAPLVYSGPVWNLTWDKEVTNCVNHMWQNFIFYNNYERLPDQCLLNTWFLALLMQLTVVGVLVLLLSYRYPKIGISSAVMITFAGIAVVYHQVVTVGYRPPALIKYKNAEYYEAYASAIYQKIFNHFGEYFAGMAMGYIVLKSKGKISPKWYYRVLGWTFYAIVTLFVMFGIYIPDDDIRIVGVYIAIHRLAWGLCLAWLTYACSVGVGGMADWFLSGRFWTVYSHLSYSAYLVHVVVYLIRYAAARERATFGDCETSMDLFSITFLSYFAGFVIFVMAEEPFARIEGILVRRLTAGKQKVSTPENKVSETEKETVANGSERQPKIVKQTPTK